MNQWKMEFELHSEIDLNSGKTSVTDYLTVTGSQTEKLTGMDSALSSDFQSQSVTLTETGSGSVIGSATVIDSE